MEGVLIDQRFLLGPVIRESAPAVVYESKHPNGSAAWIKVPRGPEHAEAIRTEAKLAKALGENAIPLLDDGKTNEGLPYLVLEPVSGERLDHWRSSYGGRAPPDEAMNLGDELCRAIGRVHESGYAIAILRADAVLVLPQGGICLLELEHAKPGSAAGIREDVLRVGRVLYEMLSGVPFIGEAKPLFEVAPELPRVVTTLVDDAARGKYESLASLRGALEAARPEWLGPRRRPMSSIPPEGATYDFDGVPLSLPGGSMFDPRSLADDSSRKLLAAQRTPNDIEAAHIEAAPTWMQRLNERDDAQGDAPPPRAPSSARLPEAADDVAPEPAPDQGARHRPFVLAVIGIALVTAFFAFRAGRTADPPADGRTAAVTASATTPAPPPSATVEPPPAATVTATAEPAPARKVVLDPPSDGGMTTTLRFEGNLSPRLVFIDGAVLGITANKEVRVPCGHHALKIGAKGTPHWLDLRCEGQQTVHIENNGSWQALDD